MELAAERFSRDLIQTNQRLRRVHIITIFFIGKAPRSIQNDVVNK